MRTQCGAHGSRQLTMSLVFVRISLHLAEHARCLLVTWYRFISVIAFFHSAEVYGSTGREAGACCD